MSSASPEHVGLGLAIREKRTQSKLTQTELAELAGLDRSYIGGVERGERNLSFASLLRIAHALGVKLSELVALAERLSP